MRSVCRRRLSHKAEVSVPVRELAAHWRLLLPGRPVCELRSQETKGSARPVPWRVQRTLSVHECSFHAGHKISEQQSRSYFLILRKAFLLLLLALFAMIAQYTCKRDLVLQFCLTDSVPV